MKIITLIVTYNRCESLKKAYKRLSEQKRKSDEILIINNHSTDGTNEFLKTIDHQAKIVHLKENIGGAGAYFVGLALCESLKADWIFCMEDDIIIPTDFLKQFESNVNQYQLETKGFIYPKVISIHNRHHLDGFIYLKPKQNQNAKYPSIEKAQFAGLMVNAQMIAKVGLPIKEFFIYFDDWDYTQRISKHSEGVFISDLFVWHNDFLRKEGAPYLYADQKTLWKNLYGIRNELVCLKQQNKYLYTKQLIKHCFWIPCIIIRKRKEQTLKTAFLWFKWSFSSLLMDYKIEHINTSSTNAFLEQKIIKKNFG